MRTIIAGSRGITDYALVVKAIKDCGWKPTVVISGTCEDSPDVLGEQWAEKRGVPIERFPANWKRFGNRAGMMRNQQMALLADALIAVWDGVSPGTKHMIEAAQTRKLRVFVLTKDNK